MLLLHEYNRPKRIEMIGAGGTGARLAELLCRLIVGFQMPGLRLRIWDGDAVEPANIARQNFEPCEIGANKALAVGLRLSARFGIEVEAVGQHLDEKSLREDTRGREKYGRFAAGEPLTGSLVVTCTDNLASRRLVARVHRGWWLDVGNGLTAGQAVLGCTHDPGTLARIARDWQTGRTDGGMTVVEALPDLAGVDPSLMRSRKPGPAGPSCAAMPFAVQGFGVNELAALAAASLVNGLMVDGRLSHGAVFFDAAAGRMTPRPITRDWYELHAAAKGACDGR